MSAETSRTAPTARCTGYRPPATAGATRSMTTVRRGALIECVVTAGSLGEAEAERGREREQVTARVRPLGPDLEEPVLGRPVPVPDAETARAFDERGRLRDALARRRRGDDVEGACDRAVHDESLGHEVERQAEGSRFVDDADDAVRDHQKLRQGLELGGDLLFQHVARDNREGLGNGRVGLSQVVDELAVLLPDLPVRLLVALEGRPDDVAQDAPPLIEEEVAERREPAGEVLVEPADEVGDALARAARQQVGLKRVVGGLIDTGPHAALIGVASEVMERIIHTATSSRHVRNT